MSQSFGEPDDRLTDAPARVVGAVAIGWGAVLLTVGPACWRLLTHRRPSRAERATVRFLGARQLLTGAAQLKGPVRLEPLWAAVDLVHAATMAWPAARNPRHRAPALVSGAIALTFGVVTAAGTLLHQQDVRRSMILRRWAA